MECWLQSSRKAQDNYACRPTTSNSGSSEDNFAKASSYCSWGLEKGWSSLELPVQKTEV